MLLRRDLGYIYLSSGRRSRRTTLMRGFTTVRDLGGPSFGLKHAIDEGVVAGPRIYPSGAIISVTSGHGDFRQPFELPRVHRRAASSRGSAGGQHDRRQPRRGSRPRARAAHAGRVPDQADRGRRRGVRRTVRSTLSTFTTAELRAAVEAAENWGTYVTVHAYTPASIQRAIDAGVKVIEHGHLMDEPTAKLIADKGIWLSTPAVSDEVGRRLSARFATERQFRRCSPARTVAYKFAKKYKIKTAFGTDVLFSQALAQQQGALLAKLTRWYTPARMLIMATGTNAELLALSGKRNPYPGKLGVVEEGALADLLLVDGNPVENIKLIADPAKNFVVIMKDGKIFKNTLPR